MVFIFKNTLKLLLCVVTIFFSSSIAFSANVKIKGSDPQQNLVIETSDANLSDVLNNISETFNFKVKGLHKVANSDRYSITYRGKLNDILQRLLRNRNYMIIRSADSNKTIERLVILNNKSGSAPSSVVVQQIREKGRQTRIRQITSAITKRRRNKDYD